MGAAFNAADATNVTLTNSNLTAQATSSPAFTRFMDAQVTGKYYAEWTNSGSGNSGNGVGIASCASVGALALQNSATQAALCKWVGSTWFNGNTAAPSLGLFWTTCDMAVDLDNAMIWFRTDGGNWNGNAAYNPATNTGGIDISTICKAGVVPVAAFNNTTGVFTINTTTAARAVPSGFTTGWPLAKAGVVFDPVSSGSVAGVGVSSKTIGVSTSGTNRIVSVLVYISNPSAAPTVNGVSDSAGLTWTLRKRYQWETNFSVIEEWWAKAPTQLTNDTVTVTLTGSCDCMNVASHAIWSQSVPVGHQPIHWYISGSGSTLANGAYDTDASLAAVNNGSSTAPSVGSVSTSGEDMIIAIFGCGNANVGSSGGSAPVIQGTGLGLISSFRQIGTLRDAYITVGAKYAASPVSGDTETMSTLSTTGAWGMVADGITSAPGFTVPHSQAVMIG